MSSGVSVQARTWSMSLDFLPALSSASTAASVASEVRVSSPESRWRD